MCNHRFSDDVLRHSLCLLLTAFILLTVDLLEQKRVHCLNALLVYSFTSLRLGVLHYSVTLHIFTLTLLSLA